MTFFDKKATATASDVRGLQLVLAQIHLGKLMFDQGKMDMVHAALFAAGQMLEPMLYRFENEVGMPHASIFNGLPATALLAGLEVAEAAATVNQGQGSTQNTTVD